MTRVIDFEPYYRDNERIGPSQLGCCRGRNNFTQEVKR